MKKGNLIAAVFCCLLGVLVLASSWSFPSSVNNVPGPGVFPAIISVILIIAGVILLFQNLREPPSDSSKTSIMALRPKIYFFIGIFLYVLFISFLGFITTTTIFLFFMIKNLGKNSYKYSFIYSGLISLAIYTIFRFLLNVPIDFGFII